MELRRIDHVAIAVEDLGAAWQLFGGVMGGEFVSGGDDPNLGLRVLEVRFPPGMKIELITPLDDDSYLRAYLDKRGEGVHHITMFVDDVVATDAELRDAGYETVDLNTDDPGWRETFIRPKSGFGALIQLTDTQLDWDTPQTQVTPEQVIAGEVIWDGTVPPRLKS